MGRITVVIAVVLASLGANGPASAAVCWLPDDEAPIIGPVQVEASPGARVRIINVDGPYTDVGTRVSADVFDYPNVDPATQRNSLVAVILDVDDGAYSRPMSARDGRISSSRESVFHVVPPAELGPGPHELTVTATDACGNTSSVTERFFQYTFLVNGTCAGPADIVC